MILFDEVPHYGAYWLLYKIAKKLNIRTIILQQWSFVDCTLFAENIEDFGNLIKLKPLTGNTAIAVENYVNRQLYYMPKEIKHEHQAHAILKSIISIRSMLRVIRHSLRSIRKFPIKINFFKKLVAIFAINIAGIGKKAKNAMDFVKLYKENTNLYPNLETPFVLFAMHYEPELTTFPMGGEYCDQARAIEKLRRITPHHIPIYIKDHPNSFGAHRNSMFYMRVKTLQNVEFISSRISNDKLFPKATLVATITGTIGFEAVCKQKPVLTFGYAWYNGISGVSSIYEDKTYEEIVNHETSLEQIKKDFGDISLRFAQFCPYFSTNKQYIQHINRKQNTEKFVKFFRSLNI